MMDLVEGTARDHRVTQYTCLPVATGSQPHWPREHLLARKGEGQGHVLTPSRGLQVGFMAEFVWVSDRVPISISSAIKWRENPRTPISQSRRGCEMGKIGLHGWQDT